MPPSVSGLSILLVDDEKSFATPICGMLERAGCSVSCATTSGQVLAFLKTVRYDVVITDMLMPELDGTGVIAVTKKHQPRARIIAMSGGGKSLGSEDVLKIATKLGAHAGLSKPFPFEDLLKAIVPPAAPPPKSR